MSGRRGCGDPGSTARTRVALLAVLALAVLSFPAASLAGDAVTQPVGPGVAGSVSVTPDGAPAPVVVSYTASTFAAAVTLTVDPHPVASTPGFLLGSGNQVVAVAAADDQGAPVTALAGPLELDFTLPAGASLLDHSPVASTDGSTFRGVPECAGGLGAAQDDCFRLAGGAIHVLTRQLAVFGVVAKANVAISESGRPVKAAASGLFGDVSLIHAGPAGVTAGKVAVFPFRDRSGRAVEFRLTVDEQASVYVGVEAGARRLPILLDGTMVGGSTRLEQKAVKTLHVTILRPGALRIRLRLPAASVAPGRGYRLRVVAIDYDGNRTLRRFPFTG